MFEFIVAIIAFIGLYVGKILAFINREEMNSNREYLIFIEKGIFLVIIFFLLYFSPLDVLLVAGLAVGFLSSYLLRQPYIFLGCALAASLIVGGEVFVLFASLVFVFGLVHSGLTRRAIVFNAFIFFIPYVVFFNADGVGFLGGFVVGGLTNFMK